jgi:hypothetical protein
MGKATPSNPHQDQPASIQAAAFPFRLVPLRGPIHLPHEGLADSRFSRRRPCAGAATWVFDTETTEELEGAECIVGMHGAPKSSVAREARNKLIASERPCGASVSSKSSVTSVSNRMAPPLS